MAVLWAVLVSVVAIALLWNLVRRDSRNTRGIDSVADDLRRADDGRPEDPFSDYGNPMGPTSNR